MGAQLTNYQCPSCTGPLYFGSETHRLECDYCGQTFSIEEIESLYGIVEGLEPHETSEEKSGMEVIGDGWSDEDTSKLRAYSCPSCGAELVCDETTAATSCPYCGNPTVVPKQFEGMLKPNYIIPFEVDKKMAIEGLKRHYKGKFLLPKSFSTGNHIEEIKGVYVPFWLYSGDCAAKVTYTCTMVSERREGNYMVETTDYYDVYRDGELSFEKVPVDGSSKMPDAHMDAIEPYDYSMLKPFSMAYLPGFLADKYDMDAASCQPRADERMIQSAYAELESTVRGYTRVDMTSADAQITNGSTHYVLLPVWLLSTKWQGKDFLFAMNGQSGKLIGDLPMDKGKFWGLFVGIALPLMAILYYFLWV